MSEFFGGVSDFLSSIFGGGGGDVGLSSGVLTGAPIGAGVLDATLPSGLSGATTGGFGDITGGGGGIPSFGFGGFGGGGGSTPTLAGLPAAIGGAQAAPVAAGALPTVGGAPATSAFSGGGASPFASGFGGAPGAAAPASVGLDPSSTGLFPGGGVPVFNTADVPASGAAVTGTDPSASGGTGFQDARGGGESGNSISQLFKDPSLGNLWNAVGSNANLLIPAAALGYSAIEGNKPVQGQAQVSTAANQLAAQGAQLQQYLQTGTLPPGVQGGLKSAGEAAKATIRSRYAAQGASGSSAEQQDLANVDQQMTTQGTNIALQLLQQGVSETQISAQLYQSIMQNALQEDAQLGQAIGRFASSAAGGGTTFQLKPAGT